MEINRLSAIKQHAYYSHKAKTGRASKIAQDIIEETEKKFLEQFGYPITEAEEYQEHKELWED